jgi:peptidoglycan biosynthesis protein MviN/MurJ (putative lipid II flippase)
VLVTGLLSYAFFEIRDGNMEIATPLLAIYLLFIGLTFIVGGVLKQIREFGASSHLNDISFLIQLSILDSSIQTNMEQNKQEENIIFQIPSRKEKHKKIFSSN